MQGQVTALRRCMLPARFSPTGMYPDRVHQRAAAFRLLAHAEFESYIEDATRSHLTARVADWKTNRKPSVTIAAVLAYDEVEARPPTSILNPPQKPSGLFDDRLDAAVNRFNQHARRFNHGVKEANVLGLVLPIGIDASALDTVWLAELDGWAGERGDFAHQSSGRVQYRLDPAREYATAKRLMAGFRRLDEMIARLP